MNDPGNLVQVIFQYINKEVYSMFQYNLKKTGATEEWSYCWETNDKLQFPKFVQGDFFNWASPENVSRLAPPKFAWSGPP